MEDSHFLRTVFVGLSGIIDQLENAKQAEIKEQMTIKLQDFCLHWFLIAIDFPVYLAKKYPPSF